MEVTPFAGINHEESRQSFTLIQREGVTLENSYKDEIFTKRVRAGKRTYFFDVKSTKSEKDFFITITESKRVGEQQYEKHKIFLYKEDFEKFRTALEETVGYIEQNLLPQVQPENVEGEQSTLSV
jgi:hypothetical protein